MAGIIDRTLVSWYIQQNLFTLLYGFIRTKTGQETPPHTHGIRPFQDVPLADRAVVARGRVRPVLYLLLEYTGCNRAHQKTHESNLNPL